MKVALAQYLHTEDGPSIVRQAAVAGADVVVFPEMYSNGYATFDADDEAAEARWRQQAWRSTVRTWMDSAMLLERVAFMSSLRSWSGALPIRSTAPC